MRKILILILVLAFTKCKQLPVAIKYNEDILFDKSSDNNITRNNSMFTNTENHNDKKRYKNKSKKAEQKNPSYLTAKNDTTVNSQESIIIESAPYEIDELKEEYIEIEREKIKIQQQQKELEEERKELTRQKEELKKKKTLNASGKLNSKEKNELQEQSGKIQKQEEILEEKESTIQQNKNTLLVTNNEQNLNHSGYIYHKVKNGDNLSFISKKYNVKISTIVNLNNLKRPYNIYIGQKIKIPVFKEIKKPFKSRKNTRKTLENNNSIYTLVLSGDTLLEIALDYDKSLSEIATLNRLRSPYKIYKGQKIIIERKKSNTFQNTNRDYIIVKSRDTLSEIALKHNISMLKLAEINNLKKPYDLYVGQKIKFKNEKNSNANANKSYKIRRGDNLYKIATKFDITVNSLIAENNIRSANNIYIGQILRIPTDSKSYSFEKVASISESRESEDMVPVVEKKKERKVEEEKVAEVEEEKIVKREVKKASSNSYIWPVKGEIISTFGTKKDGSFNDGIKIKAADGTPIRATLDGEVAYVGSDIKGYGNTIIIRHNNNKLSIYSHCKSLNVKMKEKVQQGDIVATVGSSGDVLEPQLYFGLRNNRTAIDPLKELNK